MRYPDISGEKILVFGGAYSNLAATQAMYDKAIELNIAPDHVICTGDLVAYCAEPQQTVDLIRDWGIHVVMGNCEESLASSQGDCGCGYEAGSACSTLADTWYAYASRKVDSEACAWMGQLPRSIEFRLKNQKFKVIHGSVTSINQFVFASSSSSFKRNQVIEAGVDAIIAGHSGIPFGQTWGNKHWLNAGVIGMPANDGTKDGWYMLLESLPDSIEVSWHRLEYNAHRSHLTTDSAGMSEYAEALLSGIWPSMDILGLAERQARGEPLNFASLQIKSS